MVGVPLYLHKSRRQPGLATNLHGISARRFFRAAAKNFILLQLLFLGLFSYIFGSLYLQGSKIHNMEIGFVDYDQGAIGTAVREAYSELRGDGFPTLIESPSVKFPTPSDLESAVCKTEYWAALYILPGASNKVHDALQSATPSFDPHTIMAYIWNQARYSTVIDQAIATNILKLSNAARIAYTTTSVPANTTLTPSTLALLANPWDLLSINIQPTAQGSRAIYNTVAIILIMMQEFFYLGIINTLHHNFQVYTKLRPTRIILFRSLVSTAYCLIGSLCLAGAIWAFRSGWDVNANQFALTWMTLWLFAHINFQILDVVSVWLPPPYVPMALVLWVVTNVSSVILPFDLSAAWYKVGYALPAHETYTVLIDVWSRGCNPNLEYALPVLFAWELLGTGLAAMGVYRRAHYAAVAEAVARREFGERVDAAMEDLRKREREGRGEEEREEGGDEKKGDEGRRSDGDTEEAGGSASGESSERGWDEARLRREVTDAMEREVEQILQDTRRESKAGPGFGPAFSLPFGRDDEQDDS
ncbi:hypothetical protein B0T16DRAFT_415439 [Cercophora newfieldiana]|uniref:DUF3533 domain-containing protein n=1 Tax=Cercophora newfieldiana TaxID=92897 RepID=A0AA39XZV9_9PEZI|nr:hypothetical protein B0T16DRAFT_415439 [Cercophora newfieldiana]